MGYISILIIIVFLLFYSLFSEAIERTIFSGPFLALIVGFVFGPAVLDLFNKDGIGSENFRTIAELTLALVLFSDASKTELKVVQKNIKIPSRLLLIGLPLTIALGMLVGYFIFQDFTWIELGLLATMLAPTDAALGKAVVSNAHVPSRIRESLNVESGLNDGISVPVLYLFIALSAPILTARIENLGFGLFVKAIGIGIVVGLLIAFLYVKLFNYAVKKKWIIDSWQQIALITLAFTCFIIAQLLGGSGFIACFVGGLLFGAMKSEKGVKMQLLTPMEGVGDSMSLITWLFFGSIIARYAEHFTWIVLLYALLSLTIIRIVPVFIALIRSGLVLKEKLFIGWFGPRGLATIVFAIIVLDIEFPHKELIILTTACTILLSVILHGFTANPMIKGFFRKSE